MRCAKKIRATRLAYGLTLLLGLSLVSSVSANAPLPSAGYLDSSGSGLMLRATPSSPWKPVAGRVGVKPGSSLRTAKAGVEVQMVDGTLVSVAPQSQVKFQPSMWIYFDRRTPARVAHMDLGKGELTLRIPQGGRPAMVMGSHLTYGAFGPGRVIVSKIPGGMLAAVHEGKGKVSERSRWTDLGEGQYQRLREWGVREGARSLAPSPEFLQAPCPDAVTTACALTVVQGDAGGVVGARWKPAAPGTQHRIVVSRDRQGHEVVAAEQLAPERNQYSAELPAGAYWLTVTALRDGVPGGSAQRPLRVVQLQAGPDAQFLDDGRLVVLPEGKSVRVGDASGLQLFADPDKRLPLPETLQVPEWDDKRRYRVHIADDPWDEVVLRVERRTLRAEIDVQPRAPRWPQEPVWITIRVHDPLGRAAAGSVSPVIKVELNGLAVPARFEESGGALRYRVAPRNGHGPWALRVEAADQHGNLLGRTTVHVQGRAQENKNQRTTRLQW